MGFVSEDLEGWKKNRGYYGWKKRSWILRVLFVNFVIVATLLLLNLLKGECVGFKYN